MNQAPPNSDMARSTAEALKQIKKQGLSISIVSTDSSRSCLPLDSSVSKETRPKQNVTIDKTLKLTPRSSVMTENKATLSQVRSVPNTSAETRASSLQSALSPIQSGFQESKMPGSINKLVTPISSSSETRAFGSQTWSNPPPTETKAQTSSNRAAQSAVVQSEKTQSGSVRISQNPAVFPENKSQNVRLLQNVGDNKSQSRISQVSTHTEIKHQTNHGRSQNQLSFEGKVQNNQSRMSLTSPPSEVKVLNTGQVRPSQNFTHEKKSVCVQRTIPQVLADAKIYNSQSKLNPDVKTPTQLRVTQTMKGTPAERIRTADKVMVVEQSSSPLLSNIVLNPFRVASTLGEKTCNSSDEKPLVKVTRISQNAVLSKNQAAIQSKTSQSLSMQSESKSVSQVVKIMSAPSDLAQKTPVSFDNLSDRPTTPGGIGTMASTRGKTKRPQTIGPISSTPTAKKKCIKRTSINTSEQDGTLLSNVELNSHDVGTPKEIGMRGITRGLTITPVNVTTTPTSTPSTSRNSKKSAESVPTNNTTIVVCKKCEQFSYNLNNCDTCGNRFPPDVQIYHVKKASRQEIPSLIVTKNVTTTSTIEKKIVYQSVEMMGQNQSFHFQQAVQGKVLIETTPLPLAPRTKRPKTKRKVEPVCYTLSSDEEEPVQPYNAILQEAMNNTSQIYPIESEGSKSDHSSTSEVLQDENQEFDDPQFPGVTDINSHLDIEEEPDEEMDYDGEEIEEEEEPCSEEGEEEEEEIPDEEHDHEEDTEGQLPTDYPLRCRSIRIGSYKVHPKPTSPFVPVILALDSISFEAPVLTEPNRRVVISLKMEHIQKMLVHFGRCLPIMFVFTTSSFGDTVRDKLKMSPKEQPYFDPTSKDDKTQKLTFLIENMTEDQKQFIRHCFPGEKKVKEIDQKTANEILVRSTPNHNAAFVKLHCNDTIAVPISVDNQIPHSSNTPSQLSVTKITLPPQPVVKLLTYPPPPQTGGIAITNEDLACLNDGEFLNDAIIDFYLKYVFYERLSPYQREKTHIFSSFFYPRLTHKPERPRAGDDPSKTMQFRRHNQVKTWTRHVDIFSKDYIIIPVNQNVHWFLAIICYPSRVPEAPNVPVKPENKSVDGVTSTDEQESASRIIIKEISSNGEDDSPNQDENSMASSLNSSYEVEEPPDSDEASAETPDSSTHPDGKQRKEMPCICIFDSLSGPNRWRIPNILREYLEMEWKSKKGTRKLFDKNTMQGFLMKCPQQTNYSDCGMYLLQFVESFFENPIPFGSPMPDLTNWFTEVKISKKRQQLKDLILELQKKQANTLGTRKTNQPDGVQSSAAMQHVDNR